MPDLDRTLVAGIAELSSGDPTLLAAMDLARASGARLYLVHAYQLPNYMLLRPGLEAALPKGAEQHEQALQAQLEAAVRAHSGGENVVCRVIRGSPAPVLAHVAGEVGADLLVVGAARSARLGRAILGTTAQRVLRASPIPVLVARRPVTLPLRRVLLTTDLGDLSAVVHETALDIVDLFFGEPQHVRSLLVVGWAPMPAPMPSDALGRAAHAELDAFLRDRCQAGPAVKPVVRTGIAADEIVDEARAWDADLLVVGTHARGLGARLMLGSVAEAALRDAPCNVLAVPPTPVPAVIGAETAAWQESPELKQWLDTTAN